MFFSVSNNIFTPCAVERQSGQRDSSLVDMIKGLNKVHYASAALDLICAVALVTIGWLGMQMGFMPPGAQYFMIGFGCLYFLLTTTVVTSVYASLKTITQVLEGQT